MSSHRSVACSDFHSLCKFLLLCKPLCSQLEDYFNLKWININYLLSKEDFVMLTDFIFSIARNQITPTPCGTNITDILEIRYSAKPLFHQCKATTLQSLLRKYVKQGRNRQCLPGWYYWLTATGHWRLPLFRVVFCIEVVSDPTMGYIRC